MLIELHSVLYYVFIGSLWSAIWYYSNKSVALSKELSLLKKQISENNRK